MKSIIVLTILLALSGCSLKPTHADGVLKALPLPDRPRVERLEIVAGGVLSVESARGIATGWAKLKGHIEVLEAVIRNENERRHKTRELRDGK